MLNDEMKLLKRTRGKLMTKNRVLQSQQVKIAAQIKQLIAKAEVRVPFFYLQRVRFEEKRAYIF